MKLSCCDSSVDALISCMIYYQAFDRVFSKALARSIEWDEHASSSQRASLIQTIYILSSEHRSCEVCCVADATSGEWASSVWEGNFEPGGITGGKLHEATECWKGEGPVLGHPTFFGCAKSQKQFHVSSREIRSASKVPWTRGERHTHSTHYVMQF